MDSQPRCNSYKCQNLLNSFIELVEGTCESCADIMRVESNYVGICWNCSKVTCIGSRLNRHNQIVIPSKYIFSHACRACSGNEEANISWMTIDTNSLPVSEVTGRGEEPAKIVAIKNNQKTSPNDQVT